LNISANQKFVVPWPPCWIRT